MSKHILLIIFFFIVFVGKSQVVYEHITNQNIYEFLDEMANEKIIEINSVVKPYSRKLICDKLIETKIYLKNNPQTLLSNRQINELDFYLTAYSLEAESTNLEKDDYSLTIKKSSNIAVGLLPPGLFYKDSIFSLAIQPILGATYSNNINGNLTHTWGGASMFGYVGRNLAFYTSVRDNNENKLMIKPDYFVQQQGVPVKNYGDKGVDYSEARGGLMYSWKWGIIGLIKDNNVWGYGYNGTNIQSGRTPSFAQIKLYLKPVSWFEFNYYHGWLVSEVVDSSNSYWTNGTFRTVYYQKYIAANMFTFYPIKYLNISIGNSVVYSDVGGGGPHAAYLIPFLFFKSVDHTLNATYANGEAGQNSQMFFNIGSRNIKHLHLFFSLFIDDLSFKHFKYKEEHNFFSYKGGFRLSNFLLKNVTVSSEYTITNPFVFQHRIETQTYETNKYNMGHYLRDNSTQIYISIQYKPIRGLHFLVSYTLSQHYDDYNYAECFYDPDCNLHTVPMLKNLMWENQNIILKAKYEIVSNAYAFLEYNYQNITGDQTYIEKYTPEYYWGETSTFRVGVNVGF